MNPAEDDSSAAERPLISWTQLIVVTVLLWALLCGVYEFQRIYSLLAGPRDGDVYAYGWGFQLLVFAAFRFPFWILALLCVFILELSLLTRLPKSTA